MGVSTKVMELFGLGATKAETSIQPTSLGDILLGKKVTFRWDTCSNLAPYTHIEAGCTLVIYGVHQSAGNPGVHWIHLDDPDDLDPYDELAPSICLGIPELLEVTNLYDMIEASDQLAAAGDLLPEHF